MSIKVNGVALPDIPEDVLSIYPYATIFSGHESETHVISMLFISQTPLVT